MIHINNAKNKQEPGISRVPFLFIGLFVGILLGKINIQLSFLPNYSDSALFRAFRTRFLSALQRGAMRSFFEPSPVRR